MNAGPIACHTPAGPGGGTGEAARFDPCARRACVLPASFAAALTIAVAYAFAADGVRRRAADAAVTVVAANARFESANVCSRAAFGTGMVATSRSFSAGSRWPRKVKSR